MAFFDHEKILNVLRGIKLGNGRGDLVSGGIVKSADQVTQPSPGHVAIVMEIDPKQAEAMEEVRQSAEQAIRAMPGVENASVVMTSHRQPAPAQAVRPKIALPQIKHIIAVASGKGGVGKSTTAVNLSIALQQNGLKVGLLDADIYGPSLPRMVHVSGKPDVSDDKKMIPQQNYGIHLMSMGLLVDEEAPMVWRGPMVHAAITQLFRDVAWPALDVLVVDMPPGTGDAHLTLVQSVDLSGAVIVSTPQDIALLDARRGMQMFAKVGVPVLGLIENMSYFLCPHCHERSDIFSHGGARHEAERLDFPFLGEIPLDIAVRETSDAGTPIVASAPDSAISQVYRQIAAAVWTELQSPRTRVAG